MKDKEKQIEEIVKRIAKNDCHLFDRCPKQPKHNCISQEPEIMLESSKHYITIATWLVDADYQKVGEDSIVISKEEYEFLLKPSPTNPLTKVMNEVINSFSNNKIKLVENVLNRVKEIGAIKALLEMKSMPKLFETIHNDILKDIDELAKQFGVEIKE